MKLIYFKYFSTDFDPYSQGPYVKREENMKSIFGLWEVNQV